LIAWLKDRPLKLNQQDKDFFEKSIATYTTTLAESQQERLLPEKANKSKSAKSKLLHNGDSSDDDKCPSVASDATSSTTSAAKMKRHRHLDLEGFTEEAKKIRKLLTTSVCGDGIRSSIHSLVLEQSTMITRLTALGSRIHEELSHLHTKALYDGQHRHRQQ
jgi:hypothetical protein